MNTTTDHAQESGDSIPCNWLQNSGLRVLVNGPTWLALTAFVIVAFLSGCATAPKPAKAGKLYHVGLIWLKDPGNAEHREKIIAAAHAFAREIPEVQFLSVGQTLPNKAGPYVDASFDVCVVMRFADTAAMERYGKNPVHEKAAREAFLPLSQRILFYDFTSE